jgi:uncharacterized membrane protein YbaN (DUF454 family)
MIKLTRWPSLLLAYFFLALALIGVVLPGLPTVPFLLLTTWFAAKGSERLHHWLYAHPHLGKLLIDWEQQGAVSRPSKVMAVILLSVSWGIMYVRIDNLWVMAGLAVLFLVIISFLLSRPEPRSEKT